jgi:hypothetical protein
MLELSRMGSSTTIYNTRGPGLGYTSRGEVGEKWLGYPVEFSAVCRFKHIYIKYRIGQSAVQGN